MTPDDQTPRPPTVDRRPATGRPPPPGPAHAATDARQGEVILRHRWSRGLFVAGLALGAVLAVLVAFAVS